jgi:hypothetical protein
MIFLHPSLSLRLSVFARSFFISLAKPQSRKDVIVELNVSSQCCYLLRRPLNSLDSQFQYVTIGEWLGAGDKFFIKRIKTALIHLVHPVDPV